MRILIEEYKYRAQEVREVLRGIDALEDVDGYVCVNYVGYFYNPHINDCVFILPKVLMDESNKVFRHLSPEGIIHMDKSDGLRPEEKSFIYEFSVWVYRAISVFNRDNENEIVYHKKVEQMGGKKRFISNTFLDILMALVNFNRENQNYFTFVLKNLHSGYNKINWTRTISHSTAIVNSGVPVYTDIVNKKRQVNFDEELLVIYYSILNYINDRYGFKAKIDVGFELITGNRFKHYLNGFGVQRLKQIKYKYFSDKALTIWEMCMAFFDRVSKIQVSTKQQEYLLVKNFNIVFEAIIDELIGEKHIPDGLIKQYDGKEVDHMYKYKGLIENNDKRIYYIGDSKYYKIGAPLGRESIYKQYTYARNVIQWNLNLFLSNKPKDIKLRENENILRDDSTEGYNIIPNFFISAQMDEALSYTNDGVKKKWDKPEVSRQFENRLFDRDTLLLFYYDVNFLFVLSLYARENSGQKTAWRNKIRETFRTDIQGWLQSRFTFYAMTARQGVNAEQYLKSHFQEVLGKVYRPFAEPDIYSLALDDTDPEGNNAELLERLRKVFYVERCDLGENPLDKLAPVRQGDRAVVDNPERNGVLMVMMENYSAKSTGFLSSGKLAIGVKYTKDSMNIVEHLKSIGYVLFHHRNVDGQHLFAVNGNCRVLNADEVEATRYKNVNTTEMYIAVDIDVAKELDASVLNSTKKNYTKTGRYDAQFATIAELS